MVMTRGKNPEGEAPEEVDVPFASSDGPVTLGDAAREALHDISEHGGVQDVLDDTDYTKVRFVGMSFDSLEKDIKIGDEMTFKVRARCIGTADEASRHDGMVRHIVKMDVQSVVVEE